MFNLENKKIVVTGASSGIGRAIAIQCANQGAEIHLVARAIERLEETRLALKLGQHVSYQIDLSLEEEIIKLADKLPQLDGVILNAGTIKTTPVKFIKKEALDYIFNVNITSSILLIQCLLKKKKIKDGAAVCFISSASTQKVTYGNSMYVASKGAVNTFTKALALELATNKIRVNAILPGFIETALMDNSIIDKEKIELHKNNYPLGRFGKPEDVAYLAIYLMADESAWMTGSLLNIDGGYTLK